MRRCSPVVVVAAAASLLVACRCGELVVPEQNSQRPAAAVRRPARAAEPYQRMFTNLARAARSHQLADLVPFVTTRLRADLVSTVRHNRQRFWTHIDRMIDGINSGLTVGTPRKREDGRLDLPLRFANGDAVTPVIAMERGRPRIDRF